MTKEDYIALKEKQQIDIGLAYEMYMETAHPMAKLSMNEFMNVFPMWVTISRPVCEKYWEYYDKKFEIV